MLCRCDEVRFYEIIILQLRNYYNIVKVKIVSAFFSVSHYSTVVQYSQHGDGFTIYIFILHQLWRHYLMWLCGRFLLCRWVYWLIDFWNPFSFRWQFIYSLEHSDIRCLYWRNEKYVHQSINESINQSIQVVDPTSNKFNIVIMRTYRNLNWCTAFNL